MPTCSFQLAWTQFMVTPHFKQLQAQHASPLLPRITDLLCLQCTFNAQMCSKSIQHSGSQIYGSSHCSRAFQKHQTCAHTMASKKFLDMWQPRWIYCLLTPNWSLNICKLWTNTENTQDFLGKALVKKVIMPVKVNRTSWLNYNLTSRSSGIFCLHHRLMHISHGQMTGCIVYKYLFNSLWKKALFECTLSVKHNYLSSIFWLSPMTDLQENILLTKHVTVGHIWWQYISNWSKSAVREIRLVIISLQ